MKSHHKAILLVLGCLSAILILPVLMAVYWHFFVIGLIIISFGLSIGIVVVFTYIDIKNELEWNAKVDENLTYGFSDYQKRFYHNCLKYLRGKR